MQPSTHESETSRAIVSVPSPSYHEYPPPARLAELVECFWTISGALPADAARMNRVLPDGCTDVIFDFGSGATSNRVRVVGTMLTALVVSMRGTQDLLGVRFHPGQARRLLRGVAAHELTGRLIPADAIWGDAPDAIERLGNRRGVERVTTLAGLLHDTAADADGDRRVGRAVDIIVRTAGRVSVDALLHATGTSRRRLEQLFAQHVGIPPRALCTIVRFRRAAAMLRDVDNSVARVAQRCGYHDQAHLTRQFRALAGIAPAAYRRERHFAFVQASGDDVA